MFYKTISKGDFGAESVTRQGNFDDAIMNHFNHSIYKDGSMGGGAGSIFLRGRVSTPSQAAEQDTDDEM